jgi:hypothetical protein
VSRLLYLHCIVEPDTGAHQLLIQRAVPGMDPDAPLFPLEACGLVAAVSHVPAETFEEEPLNALLTDLPKLTPVVVRHEEAIRSLLPVAPALVPMAFGTVYRNEERIAALLREQREALTATLEELRGKDEWGIKLFAEHSRLLAGVAGMSAAVQHLQTEAETAGTGRAYLLRKQREKLVAAEASQALRDGCVAVIEGLSALSASVRTEAPPAQQPDDRQLVLKAAFLVERVRVAEFKDAAAALAERYSPLGLDIELSGPWAAYSFVGARLERA